MALPAISLAVGVRHATPTVPLSMALGVSAQTPAVILVLTSILQTVVVAVTSCSRRP